MKSYDVIILGGGPAGASAGIYVRRAGSSVLVLDNGNSKLKRARTVQNYYGFEDISGDELLKLGVKQLTRLGAEIKDEEVLEITNNFDNHTYTVITTKDSYTSKAIILCIGAGKKKSVDGLEPYENANVSYCAICDGFLYRGKKVAVIGDGEFACHEAEHLSKNAKEVYLIGKISKEISKLSKNIKVIDKNIASFEGNGLLESIVFEDNSKLNIDGLFVALGSLSGFELAKQLGIITTNNTIVVDQFAMTNLPGVFAAGDAIGGINQVSTAVGEGARAGLEAVRYIKVLEGDEEK